jgi:cytochrome c556
MVALDDTFSKLNQCAKAGWKPAPEASASSIDPAHEAVLLREHFEEMQRLEELSKYPAEFVRMLKESEQAAVFIESMLNPIAGELRLKPIHRKALDVNLTSIRSNCTSCHQQFRDNPN